MFLLVTLMLGRENILEALGLAALDEFNNSGKPISLKDLCRYEELIGLYNDGNKQKEIQIQINGFAYLLKYFDQNTMLYDVFEDRIFNDKSRNISDASKRLSIKQSGDFSQISTNVNKKQPQISVKKYQFNTFKFQLKITL